tara:strand:+ start:509 stop:943 length:435 start_codon:yes stop_codon:yes gene_type:complete
MVKKTFLYIFIYIILIGCESGLEPTNECETNCYLKVSAPNLQLDENGYYHMSWLSGYYQTFSTLNAETGSEDIVKVMWDSNSGISYNGEWVSSVNHASYTSDDGIAHTVLSAWEQQIDDTITVYSWYWDRCDNTYIDSIEVVID